MSTRTLRAGLALGAALLATLVAAPSAQAYPLETHIGYASSSTYGYGAYEVMTEGYGVIYAMDTHGDGYRIVTTVYNQTLGGDQVAFAYDANGDNSSSGPLDYDYLGRAGDQMKMVTCRQNGAGGTPFNCKTTYFKLPY
ncbi:hypothetical protein ACIGEZ_13485 [Streptomyces sp. NPDC085481]|uniref:hypothetical protein n=1 Tax=Streptomyces sp. NPDC085481 TaxID=3365727 RepID=UPI0037D0B8A7